MLKKDCQPLRKPTVGTGAGFMLLAVMLALLAGCAVGGKNLSGPAAEDSARPAVAEEQGVTSFEDGRAGFVIREIPHQPETWRDDFAAAVVSLNEQDYPRAVELLQQVIEHEPGVTAPYINIALAYRRLGEPEPAEQNLKKALEVFPAHPVASNEYGLLLRNAGRFAEARTAYEQTLARFPDYYPVRRNLGILCDLYLNDLECALEQYQIYSAEQPEDEQAQMWIADLRLRLGR